MRFRVGKRLSWVLGNVRSAMAAYAVSGSLIGSAIGYFNWAQDRAHVVGTSMEQTIRFVFFANAIWSAILAVLVTFPLFFFLFSALPSLRLKSSRKDVFFALIFPCAALQIFGPLLVGGLYFALPSLGKRLQMLAPNGNPGDIIAWTQMIMLLLGSWLGAAFLFLLWRGADSSLSSLSSRLLPVE